MTQTTKIIYKGRLISVEELMKILAKEFSKHIGEEEGISIDEILRKYFEDYEEWSVWKRYTYFDLIHKCISLLRRKGDLFIINRKRKHFVLKTQKEADYYKNILKRDIIAMDKSMVKADEWVRTKKWKNIK